MIGLAAWWLGFGGIVPSAAQDRFDPVHHADLVGLQDVDFDSGWIPVDSPVQLRLMAHAADSTDIEMLGVATFDWDAETLGLVGDELGGWFALDVGVDIHASVRFDVAGIQWESDLLGPFDYTITAEAEFTPYLLPGHPEAPVVISDHTDGVPVAAVPIVPDIIVASGELEIAVAADLEASLHGRRVELTTAGGTTGAVTATAEAAALAPETDVDPLVVDGVMVVGLQTSPTLVLQPHLTMSILGQDFDIFGIDIPITLPPTDDEIAFEPETMQFEAPPPAPAGDGTGGDGSGGDDAGATTGGATTGGGTDGDGSTGETDGTGAGAADDVSGCACRPASGSGRAGSGWGALVLLLVGARRRRQKPSARSQATSST